MAQSQAQSVKQFDSERCHTYFERLKAQLPQYALIDVPRLDAGVINPDISIFPLGIGIPDDQQARIFEEFHQVGNPEHDRGQGLGLGLGLAIVKRTRTCSATRSRWPRRRAGGRSSPLRFPSRPCASRCRPECHHDAAAHGFHVAPKPVTPSPLQSTINRFLDAAE